MFVFLSSYPALLFKTKTQGFGGWCGRSKQGSGRERGLESLWKSLGRSPAETQGEKAGGTEEPGALHTSAGKTAIADARSASALPLHRGLRDRAYGVTSLSGNRHPPALHPSREPGECLSCTSVPGRRLQGYSWGGSRLPQRFLFAYGIGLFSQAAAPIGIAGREARERGRQRRGARGSEKEAGGGKESFKLRREMEANF